MAQKRSIPPAGVPIINQGGLVNREWYLFFESLAPKAATQTDGSDAAGDPPTQVEFNALVAVVNALIDKLQAGGLME